MSCELLLRDQEMLRFFGNFSGRILAVKANKAVALCAVLTLADSCSLDMKFKEESKRNESLQ